jgi:hypothetical protein
MSQRTISAVSAQPMFFDGVWNRASVTFLVTFGLGAADEVADVGAPPSLSAPATAGALG